MILFENVTKSYDNQINAVDNVSLQIDEGDTVVLLGPSGCGKTTLLRMVNRLVSVTGGNIFVGNKNINELDKIKLRRNIGYVIQSNGLFPNMTIEENVVSVLSLLGMNKKKKERRYFELMELIGMDAEEFRNRYPHELSGGQQQRVGIARALASDPPVMLMDEPFGALDPVIRNHLQNEFLNILREVKKTVLFVSHDVDEAIKMGDKIAVFDEGQLMQHGSPNEILLNPNSDFISDFVGQDRALKRLSLFNVKDLIEGNYFDSIEDLEQSVDNKIHFQSDLKDTLSHFLGNKNSELLVIDENNEHVGIVNMKHVESFVHNQT